MPPRSIADATRFTPTGPHAFTPSSGANPAETAQQRVARLRDASRRAKASAQAGTFADRLIDRGRIWADRAHRITAVGLMAATVMAGGLTIYATADMMMFNRKKRAAYAEQKKLEKAQEEATLPVAVLEERKVEEASKGPVAFVKGWAMKGLTPAEQEYKNKFEKEEERVAAENTRAAAAAKTVVIPETVVVMEKKSGSWWPWGGKK